MPQVRIYIQGEIKKNQQIFLDKSYLHYLKNVMRIKNEQNIIIFNDKEEWESTFLRENNFYIKPQKFIRKKKDISDIWICFGLVKPRNIDFLVEKVSEIGVTKIIPITTKFSLRQKINYSRLKRISIEAVEQSNSLNIPTILQVSELEDVIQGWDDDRLIIFCDEKAGIKVSTIKKKDYKFNKIAIFIGPVGGWEEKERLLIRKKKNIRINFGENILKADTAAIYCLSLIKGFFFE